MLTLFIFSSRDFDPKKAVDSVPVEDKNVVFLDERRLDDREILTEWGGYLMADEMLEWRLSRAMEKWFASDFECLKMFKQTRGQDGVSYFQTPRFFRNRARFRQNDLCPSNIGELRCERVLDGMIIDV